MPKPTWLLSQWFGTLVKPSAGMRLMSRLQRLARLRGLLRSNKAISTEY